MNFIYDKNYFRSLSTSTTFFVMIALSFLAVSIMATSNIVFADVIPPNMQMDLDFTPKEVVCKESLVKAIRTSDGGAACIKLETVDLLVQRGFVLEPSPEVVSEAEEKQQSKPVGTITHMATTKHFKNPGEVETFPRINTFSYVFKICALDEKINSPEVIINSDSETKSVKLPRDIKADSCHTTATKVRASDSNSISSRLLNQGGVTEIITELENKIEDLTSQLKEQRAKISEINPEHPTSDRAKKVSAIHKKISDIRNELKDVRSEMQKYLLFLNLKPTSDVSPISKTKSITGLEVDSVLYEIISVHQALIQPENLPENTSAYNVIFEVCTGKDALRIPVVQLSSDTENKTIKMAEKIVLNSCQVSTGKITAKDPTSISIQLAGQTADSFTVVELEQKISELKDIMTKEQQNLNAIATSSSISKEERQAAINESVIKIDELRKELNSTKIELHKILLQTYR